MDGLAFGIWLSVTDLRQFDVAICSFNLVSMIEIQKGPSWAVAFAKPPKVAVKLRPEKTWNADITSNALQ